MGLGSTHYFNDPFNIFDFTIVVISTVDVSLTSSKKLVIKGSKGIQALRAFRLLRVIKIFKGWK